MDGIVGDDCAVGLDMDELSICYREERIGEKEDDVSERGYDWRVEGQDAKGTSRHSAIM